MLARPPEKIREDFPGLCDAGVALDGAAGTLVPVSVIDAVAEAMQFSMANVHGEFAASARSAETIAAARSAIADLVGGEPEGVVFGPNMTTLTFHFADALARNWGPGDEVVVCSLDHDANIRPWVLAAERCGARARWAEFDPRTGELSPEAFDGLLSERTRLVALTAASNAIGTRPEVRAISDRVHAAGALTYVDGVHATPHAAVDVDAVGADFYVCSAYKFFGPHIGAVIASPALLEGLRPAKLAPAPETVPERFERGTPAFELLAGVAAAVDWLARLTEFTGTRRERLLAAMQSIEQYLDGLLRYALKELAGIRGVRVLGEPRRRTPTISFLIDGHPPHSTARQLAVRGVSVWAGDNYAFELMRRFGLGESGAVRASIVLYNTLGDLDRFFEAVAEIAAQ